MTTSLIPAERIVNTILLIRKQKVMVDTDLAALYGVSTSVLNQAVRRNEERFPPDFMFQLTKEEAARLRSQIVISNARGGRRHRPYVFTEQGVAMLSSVIRSRRAIAVNVTIMRAFVGLRRILATDEDLARRVMSLERKCDANFRTIFAAIRELGPSESRTRRQIGFRVSALRTS